jgi:hypothetical protein
MTHQKETDLTDVARIEPSRLFPRAILAIGPIGAPAASAGGLAATLPFPTIVASQGGAA